MTISIGIMLQFQQAGNYFVSANNWKVRILNYNRHIDALNAESRYRLEFNP